MANSGSRRLPMSVVPSPDTETTGGGAGGKQGHRLWYSNRKEYQEYLTSRRPKYETRLATTVALNTGRPAGMRRTDNSIGAKQNKAEAVSGADTEPKPRHNVVGPPSRDASLERASCQAIHPRKGLLQLQLLA
ncbi:hypothetical protein AXG93_1847s1500 [Marchantia polymorpha subsp. ruderalis]|uniref:Uncharacterized protein n=1 Tax=Marchantia polymorpha subsp. ruderalis TaxID=1480154 RepID=A0A176VID1_MARPO|nr:hypothetical protein AXG93_1847s1500 [Marchantia polymorpha subsp. ruderalis]